MHLLMLKRLSLHFTIPLVNVALKFYVVSLTSSNFKFLKVETQSVQVCWICTTFRYNQMQFKRVELPSLGNHMVYLRLSHPSYELERTISHSNLTIYKHWNEEKILRKFTTISNSYCQKYKHHLQPNQLNLFSSFIHLSLSSIFECS